MEIATCDQHYVPRLPNRKKCVNGSWINPSSRDSPFECVLAEQSCSSVLPQISNGDSVCPPERLAANNQYLGGTACPITCDAGSPRSTGYLPQNELDNTVQCIGGAWTTVGQCIPIPKAGDDNFCTLFVQRWSSVHLKNV